MMTTTISDWFTVDRVGLAKKLARKPKQFVVVELMQNAWDAPGVTEVIFDCGFERGLVNISIRDNSPKGFDKLEHAYTLFAPSIKEKDFLARGRFNSGEKFVFSICKSARVETTSGTLVFDSSGRTELTDRLEVGSLITCSIPASRREYKKMLSTAERLIVPRGIKTIVNGTLLQPRIPEQTFPAILKTEAANEAGELKSQKRQTEVSIYTPKGNEGGWVYEMGIPIVATGDKWDYDVGQKIPVTMDREALTKPGFLPSLRLAVFNAAYARLDAEDCNQPWVHAAVESKKSNPAAVQHYMEKRFSTARVSYDPSDREANKLAVSKGFEIVHGNMLSRQAWERVKEVEAILPAGKVTPSPKPFTPGAPPYRLLDDPSPEMLRVKAYAVNLAREVIGCEVSVIFADDPKWFPLAVYGPSRDLILNVGRLGRKWFSLAAPESENRDRINRLLIHEWGHHYELDHLSSEYHEALCKIGAKLAEVVAAGKLPPL